MIVTARHPRTRTVYRFPKDAKKYRALVYRLNEAHPCIHGHYDCAAWERGPCVCEIAADANLED